VSFVKIVHVYHPFWSRCQKNAREGFLASGPHKAKKITCLAHRKPVSKRNGRAVKQFKIGIASRSKMPETPYLGVSDAALTRPFLIYFTIACKLSQVKGFFYLPIRV